MQPFFTLLAPPYLNQYDAPANLPPDIFHETPDLTPYDLVQPDLRLFDPSQALKPFDRNFDWNALLKSPKMDDPRDMLRTFKPENDDEEEE